MPHSSTDQRGGPLWPSKTSSLISFATLIALVCLPHGAQSSAGQVADLCDRVTVDTAAHLVFQDGVQRYFVTSGPHFWLLNVTSDIPDVQSASTIPYNFIPDVAILKNRTTCSDGHLSLLLIQMKRNSQATEAEWLTLEMRIGNWNHSEPPITWDKVNKIAQCDLEAQVCTTTDNYFTTMKFDFKKKLSSALGTIGEKNIYKVVYKSQCIKNPYEEVRSYPPVNIGTETTAAMSTDISDHSTVIIFDRDMHIKLDNMSLSDLTFERRLYSDIEFWQNNVNQFFTRCPPLVDSAFSFLFMDIFSSSKKHFAKKQFILIASAIVLLGIIILILAILVLTLLKRPRKRGSVSPSSETNEEQLIEQRNDVQIKSNENGEQQKILLQTSC